MPSSLGSLRIRLRTTFAVVLALALSACASFTAPVISENTRTISPVDREIATLAFVAYVGDSLEGSDREVERTLQSCLPREIARQPALSGRWTLEWGPVVYKFHGAELDDNMLYAVRNRGNPRRVVVVTRGTNPKAILDWLREDFDVSDTVAWPYGTVPDGLKPRVSRATWTGLQILQELAPASILPNAGQTIKQYLRTAVEQGVESIAVAGHSLGGALAPTLALWLEDERTDWDPTRKSALSVYALAGPTPGDADFAAYYDGRLGPTTQRFHNPYDVAPLAWNVATLRTAPNLYQPVIEASLLTELAATAAIDLVRDKDYLQIVNHTLRIPGGILKKNYKKKKHKKKKHKCDFLDQAAWQHHFGYVCGMRLDLIPVSTDCISDPAPGPPQECPSPMRIQSWIPEPPPWETVPCVR